MLLINVDEVPNPQLFGKSSLVSTSPLKFLFKNFGLSFFAAFKIEIKDFQIFSLLLFKISVLKSSISHSNHILLFES